MTFPDPSGRLISRPSRASIAMRAIQPFTIVLRQSPDWTNQTYADLEKTREFCRMVGRPEDFIIERVKLWDRTFSTGFFSTRQAMKEITLENLHSVAGATIVPIAQVKDVLDPGRFYLFIDDDDWYAPDIGGHLAGADPRTCDAVVWGSAVFGRGLSLRMDRVFWTNSYAVSGTFLLQRKGNLDRVSQHFGAQGTFYGKPRSFLRRLGVRSVLRRFFVPGYRTVVALDRYCSATNKHPASTVVLESLGDNPTADDLRRLIQEAIRANRTAAVPPEFLWAKPYMDRVNDFYTHLLGFNR